MKRLTTLQFDALRFVAAKSARVTVADLMLHQDCYRSEAIHRLKALAREGLVCVADTSRPRRYAITDRGHAEIELHDAGFARCTKCQEVLAVALFYARPWGLSTWCRACKNRKRQLRYVPRRSSAVAAALLLAVCLGAFTENRLGFRNSDLAHEDGRLLSALLRSPFDQASLVRAEAERKGFSRVRIGRPADRASCLRFELRHDTRGKTISVLRQLVARNESVPFDDSVIRYYGMYMKNAATETASVRDGIKQRASARAFFARLSTFDRFELGDQLVLGDFDWRDWFETKPSRAFLDELDNERILWESQQEVA